MRANRIVLITLLGLVGSGGVTEAQRIPADIPAAVIRRVSQAIWPDQLFDSTGRPERGFSPDGFQPRFSDLVIEARDGKVTRLPGVRFFYGHAYPSHCSDCGMRVASVAVRGDSSLTLMGPDDINKLIPWLREPIALADSGAARELLLEILTASCIIGCRIEWLRPNQALSEADSSLARHVDGSFAHWTRPPTSSHVSPGQMEMQFLLIETEAVWVVNVTQQGGGRFLRYAMDRSAWLGIRP